jgi:hypothetical protein
MRAHVAPKPQPESQLQTPKSSFFVFGHVQSDRLRPERPKHATRVARGKHGTSNAFTKARQ